MRLDSRRNQNLPASSVGAGHGAARRSAFTLIELLVVIAIIAVLTALGAAAYFATINRQQRNNTITGLQALDKILMQHWNQVVKEANEEDYSAAQPALQFYFTLGSADQKRMRIIWVKLRLMEAFPLTFNEILDPANFFMPYKSNLIPSGLRKNLPQYRSTLLQAKKNGANPANDEAESSACLLLALSVNRGGIKLDRDTLGAGYIQDSNKDGIEEIVDGWQKAIKFYRFPTGNAELQAAAPPRVGKHADPTDSSGLLFTWLGVGSTTFDKNVHPIGTGTAWYVIPIMVSAGKDGDFALTDDNLYSFKLRQ